MSQNRYISRGSSPRMRGAQTRPGQDDVEQRIIPAYAGSTCTGSEGESSSWDHPRVCGEHPVVPDPQTVMRGSSPRMRGAPLEADPSASGHRIIPPYAGSTCSIGPSRSSTGDHPRVCGEHHARQLAGDAYRGSSPRMRGALQDLSSFWNWTGIIPAYAGST